jgi:hypothetical protein
MKNNLNEHYGLISLSAEDLTSVNGGSGFWETLGYIIGATAKTIYVFGKTAAEYQSSLPANLKK